MVSHKGSIIHCQNEPKNFQIFSSYLLGLYDLQRFATKLSSFQHEPEIKLFKQGT
jgi:hypothetical protein